MCWVVRLIYKHRKEIGSGLRESKRRVGKGMKNIFHDEEGQGMTEYIIIVALIAIAAIAVIALFGKQIKGMFAKAIGRMGDQDAAVAGGDAAQIEAGGKAAQEAAEQTGDNVQEW